ncbi:putative sensor histidine kinase pdtaS [Pigmentiphaga humi]|uniref:Putative sensor histidine kinase pdtaS n=1 Tax=Pigmentiphaga humi TaxID=2478468 RepID=A0A3P4AWB5_9BURK|nr:sensor histidine kinase [Pigmentiphaga humi]VCU68344.1 putative sensor histidine kinase pdtaS [Pigmentiphaga humi]
MEDIQDLRLRELHHGIHNGLHLLSTALQLQARRSGSEEVRRELGIAVSRLENLVRLHEHAYRAGTDAPADAAAHLAQLVGQLQAALIDPRSGRTVQLACTGLPPVDNAALVTLSSVVIELATNSIKYGTGTVRIEVRPASGAACVQVEDEGAGFPADFDLRSHAGFGLKYVARVCARSGGSLSIDRQAAARIVARVGIAPPRTPPAS